MASLSFLAPSTLPAGKPLAGDVIVVVGSRPGQVLVAPSSALRLGQLTPVSALGRVSTQHAASAGVTASGSPLPLVAANKPAFSSGHHIALVGLGVVVPGPGGSAAVGSTRIKSTGGGGDGFSEAEALRVEIEEARCKQYKPPALHGSMMDDVVYDRIARTAGNSIEMLLTAMDKLIPASRANRKDALRIAAKFVKLEEDCMTGRDDRLADSVDGAMDGLREMRTLYVSLEPLPRRSRSRNRNADGVLPSLPGWETGLFFRNLANDLEELFSAVQNEMVRECGRT